MCMSEYIYVLFVISAIFIFGVVYGCSSVVVVVVVVHVQYIKCVISFKSDMIFLTRQKANLTSSSPPLLRL